LALAAAPTVAALHRRFAALGGRLVRIGIAAWFLALTGWGFAEPFVRAAARELALIHWRDGQWLFAQNPIVHFGYRGEAGQVGRALAWLREEPDRWLLASDRWLAKCFDMEQAVFVRSDRGRQLFLVNAGMESGQCASQPTEPRYRFRWETARWAYPVSDLR
jgi:hypothetical protein